MKNIKQIRENYNNVTRAKELQVNKLNTLVRAGLFESNKLPIVKRLLEKDPSKMTIAERKVAMSLLESLMSEFVAQNYGQLDEAANHLTKLDTRVKQGYPTDKEMPFIIILKRKAIRVYPDNQKVGLYYSQALDKYVSIPFGPNMGSINEALNPNYKYQGTLSDRESDPRYVTHTYDSGGKTKIRRADLYSQRVADLDDKDYKQLQKAYGSDSSMKWYEALGAKAGAAYARWKDKPSTAPPPSSSRVPNTKSKLPAPSPWASATSKPAAAAPTPTATASPKATTKTPKPRVAKTAAPKTTINKIRMSKKKRENLGMGDQPNFAYPNVEKKTKTFTYRSSEAPASGTEKPEAQSPRKRFNFDPKPTGTGPQPEVKVKPAGKRLRQKLQEKRELRELFNNNAVSPPDLLGDLMKNRGKVTPEKPNVGKTPSVSINLSTDKTPSAPRVGKTPSTPSTPKTPSAPRIGASVTPGVSTTVPTVGSSIKTTAGNILKVGSKVASKFMGPVGLALTAKAAYDQGPVTDSQREGDSQAQSGAANRFAAQKNRNISSEIPKVSAPEPEAPVEIEIPKGPEVDKPSVTTVTPQQAATTTNLPVVAPVVIPSATPSASLRTRRDQAKKSKENKLRRRIEIPLPDGEGSEKKVKGPPKFGLDVGLNKPQTFDPYVTLDRRTQTAYYKSLTNEENDSEILKRLKRERAKTHSYQFGGKANTSTPQSSSSSTPLSYQRRVQQRELQYYAQQPQTVSESIGYMIDNNINEMNINIKGNDIKINTTIANKINNLYESLNDENKTKMALMLEDSVDSFKQILNFAVRQ